ncbi:hypothetical protein GCM10010507_13130 [Streptomyces cinnamoneus]|uniref:Condensation domain-containing protein n=1 Tax=Streptomyces cinnamoneus TaxID=53446 RepID=A0A918WF86_STRCJ|nr:hypothetical protein GCM10010507_13130 [Streptomyces cinnamoneus]
MEFTDMAGLSVRPGTLTVWRPVAVDEHPASWRADARPASHAQEAHVTQWPAAPRPSPSWIATAFELPGPLSTEALETALLLWIDRHESLRSHLVPDGTGLRRTTLAPGAAAVRGSVVGTYLSGDALAHRIEELFDREAVPPGWPSYLFATVTHPEATTLYLGCDHSNVDGYSMALAAYEIRRLYEAALHGMRLELAEVGSFPDFAARERQAAELVGGDHETVVRWRAFMEATGGRMPDFPAPVEADEAGSAPQHNGLEWLLDADEAAAFGALCRRAGGSFCAGLLACLAMAADVQGEVARRRGSFSTLMPFHTRNQAQWTWSVGWYVGLAPLRFAARAEDGFAALTGRAMAALQEARPMAEVPVARVTELLGAPVEPRFVVSYMDFRHVPGARQWTDWKAAMVRSHRIHPHEVYLWINRTHEGAYVSFRHPRTEQAEKAVLRYVEDVRRTMADVLGGQEAAA